MITHERLHQELAIEAPAEAAIYILRHGDLSDALKAAVRDRSVTMVAFSKPAGAASFSALSNGSPVVIIPSGGRRATLMGLHAFAAEMETFPTLADTCAGGVDLDTITLDLCQRYVEEIVLLTETEIEASIRLLFEQHRLVVEGSGALGVGGLLKRKERFKGKKVVAVVCGRNIDLEVFKRIIR